MRQWLLGTGVMSALMSSSGLATPTDTPPSPIAVLITQLNEPLFPVREQATQALMKAGPEAIPLLETALKESASSEVRERVEGILERLRKDANSAGTIRTNSITLDYVNKPLAVIVNDLKTKTSINLTLLTGKVADPTRL
ncbi:MAG: HEAT repeat domain-containing protein, partial [Gemmataceae bacterium]